MSPLQLQFALAGATLLITLLGWAGTWGMLRGMVTRAISEHDKKFSEIREEQQRQWSEINANAGDVREMRGALGIRAGKAAAVHGGGD